MENKNQPNKHFQISLLVIGLLLTAGIITFMIRDFVQAVLIEPMIVLYWSTQYFITQFHQQIIWLALLFIGLHVFIRKIIDEIPAELRGRKTISQEQKPKLEQWVNKINMANQGELSRFKLFNELENLTIEVLAFQKQVPYQTMQKMIRSNEINLPFHFDTEDPFSSSNFRSSTLLKMIQRFTKPKDNVEAKILLLIKYLETQLEVQSSDD